MTSNIDFKINSTINNIQFLKNFIFSLSLRVVKPMLLRVSAKLSSHSLKVTIQQTDVQTWYIVPQIVLQLGQGHCTIIKQRNTNNQSESFTHLICLITSPMPPFD